jgi:hypothetical protein
MTEEPTKPRPAKRIRLVSNSTTPVEKEQALILEKVPNGYILRGAGGNILSVHEEYDALISQIDIHFH